MLCIFLFFVTGSYLPSPAQQDMLFYSPDTDTNSKGKLGDMIASGEIINEKKYQQQETQVADYFRDTSFLCIITIISSYSLGFAKNAYT